MIRRIACRPIMADCKAQPNSDLHHLLFPRDPPHGGSRRTARLVYPGPHFRLYCDWFFLQGYRRERMARSVGATGSSSTICHTDSRNGKVARFPRQTPYGFYIQKKLSWLYAGGGLDVESFFIDLPCCFCWVRHPIPISCDLILHRDPCTLDLSKAFYYSGSAVFILVISQFPID